MILSIIAFILTLLALATFFLEPPIRFKYIYPGKLQLRVLDILFYFITIPLIVISLSINTIAFYLTVKIKKKPIFPILVFSLYLIFLIWTSTFARVLIDSIGSFP